MIAERPLPETLDTAPLAVEVEGLSKSYTLIHNRALTLKSRFIGLFQSRYRQRAERFQALNDVSFSVARGEAIAIMGPNGSGKSTLLQVVAGILQPDNGHVRLGGRVAPLIELGAGFHPELTGIENIYLNASLYGFSNAETQRRVPDIVTFSGLEHFIDSPVKNYSTGMYMRLGFAIAVHLDPDILLADEILAVGDAEFQAQCHERIQALRSDGMTLMLVTHSEAQAQQYCDRFIRFDHGRIIAEGGTEELGKAP